MKILKNISMSVLLIFMFTSGGFAQDANEILKTIDENLTPGSTEAYRKIINEEPDGKRKEFTFFSVRKERGKTAMLYLSPASEKGRTALRLDDDMWLYIPNVGKPIRTTSSQSITGGVFSNGDIMRLDYSVEYDASFLEQGDTEYILELKAKKRTVAYDTLKMWVTKDPLLATRIECYSASGMLIKTLEFKEIKDFGNGIVRPAVTETYSPLYEGYRSIGIYAKIEPRELPDEVFTLNYLPKIGELR